MPMGQAKGVNGPRDQHHPGSGRQAGLHLGLTSVGREEPQVSVSSGGGVLVTITIPSPFGPGPTLPCFLPQAKLRRPHPGLPRPPPSGWGAPGQARARQEAEDRVFLLLAPSLKACAPRPALTTDHSQPRRPAVLE